MDGTETPDRDRTIMPGVAFLLSQLGAQVFRMWRDRMARLRLDPHLAALLRLVAAGEGRSQQALATQMRLPPSRMVRLVDELEGQGLLRRQPDPEDRRVRVLFLTEAGRKTLDALMEVSAGFEEQVCAALTEVEREQLRALLERIAGAQGLASGVHPGLARHHAGPARGDAPQT